MPRALHLVTTRRPFFDQQVRVLERNGVECTVVTVPGEARERTPAAYVRFYARTLGALLADGGFDLVHANYGLTAPAAVAQPVRPVVLSLWGSDLFGRYGSVSRACAARCDAVVVMSTEMAAALDCESYVVPHGVDTERFAPADPAEARAAVGWTRDGAHVLFPYDPARTVKDYPRAERVVEAARERLDRPVTLHAVHGVPHEAVPTYVNAADALLLTSEREGSPNSVKEALACECPVVATAVGDVPDLLDGVTGTHVCRSDEALVAALVETLDGPTSVAGRERLRTLGLDAGDRKLLDVYDDVLGTEVAG